MRITTNVMFSAAHRLLNLPRGHKCRNLHGHNWVVTVDIEGGVHSESGMLIDFGDIKALIRGLLDHTVLVAETDRDLEQFCIASGIKYRKLPVANTTCEMLAEFIAQKICKLFDYLLVKANTLTVTVEETPGSTATYTVSLPGKWVTGEDKPETIIKQEEQCESC